MKTLQHMLATILLTLVLGISTYAGDMGGPSSLCSPQPMATDGVTVVTKTTTPVPGDSDPRVLTEVALNFLMSALTMY